VTPGGFQRGCVWQLRKGREPPRGKSGKGCRFPAFLVPHILHGVLEELAIRQELPDREAFVRRTTDELARLCDAG